MSQLDQVILKEAAFRCGVIRARDNAWKEELTRDEWERMYTDWEMATDKTMPAFVNACVEYATAAISTYLSASTPPGAGTGGEYAALVKEWRDRRAAIRKYEGSREIQTNDIGDKMAAAISSLEAENRRLESLLSRNEGRVKEIVDDALLKRAEAAEADLKRVTEERDDALLREQASDLAGKEMQRERDEERTRRESMEGALACFLGPDWDVPPNVLDSSLWSVWMEAGAVRRFRAALSPQSNPSSSVVGEKG